jgi:arylsulfatase A-like enzyme
MDRRNFMVKTGQVGLGGLLGLSLSSKVFAGLNSTSTGKKPNFVFILIDDLGYADAGCLGSDFYETPNIDRLRHESMLFTENYCSGPECAPSRASILTGKYPARLNINTVGWSKSDDGHLLIEPRAPRGLTTEHVSIAKALKTTGYQTACIGKWQLDEGKKCTAKDHSFDYVSEELSHVQSPDDPKHVNYYTQETLKFIEQNKDKPFYVYLSHDAAHHPYEGIPSVVNKYKSKIKPGLTHSNAVYAANLEHMDKGIGTLIKKIDEMGLSENTVIVFTSDNGGRTAKVNYEQCTSNAPLKLGKHTLYEGGIRVPLMVRWPGRVKADSSCNVPVHGVDFFKTFVDMAGTPREAYGVVDGVNIEKLFTGKGNIDSRSLYWYFPRYMDGNYWWSSTTLCMNTRPCAAVRDGDYKLIHFFESDNYDELYDVRRDISEKTNLISVMPEKRAKLRAELDNWYKQVNAKLPVPNPNYVNPNKKNANAKKKNITE